jgi:3-oxoacyl-[acyl-carrier-protein] synthase II
MAVAAARLAVRDAGLSDSADDFSETAVVVATAFGPAFYTEKLLESIFTLGPESASPALFTESVASAAASQVAIAMRARGPSLTVTQREAGPLVAVGEGVRLLRAGRARRVLVGAVEEMTPLLHAILDRFRALARASATAGEAARPFDRSRNGFLAGEGSTFLLLERGAEAAARGARALCRVAAACSAFDPSASPIDWGHGDEPLSESLRRGLQAAGIAPESIDRVVSGASGAVAGDRLEGRVLRRYFAGHRVPVIVAPKAVVGEYGGAALGAAVLCAAAAPCGPTPGFREVDPEIGLTPHDGSALAAPGRVLASSLAAGGAAAWLILDAAG